MEIITINVYDENDNIVKTSEAQVIDLRFGTVRALMKLLKVDDINDTAELLKVVYGAWEQITGILSKVFPDIEEEDWEGVKLSELMPAIITILKSSFAHILTIPKEKNAMGE